MGPRVGLSGCKIGTARLAASSNRASVANRASPSRRRTPELWSMPWHPTFRVHLGTVVRAKRRGLRNTESGGAMACTIVLRTRRGCSHHGAPGPQAPPGALALDSPSGWGSAQACCAFWGWLWRSSGQPCPSQGPPCWRCDPPFARILARFVGCDGWVADLPCRRRGLAAAPAGSEPGW